MQLFYKKDLGFLEDLQSREKPMSNCFKKRKKEKKTLEIQTEFLLCNSKLTKSLRKHSSALSISVQGIRGSERGEKNSNRALENVTYGEGLGLSSAGKRRPRKQTSTT